jgi:hypothetical protein
MDFQTAVKILAGKIDDSNTYTKTVKTPGNVLAANRFQVAPHSTEIELTAREMAVSVIATETGADEDWIVSGDWSGDETVESVKAEWEELDAT